MNRVCPLLGLVGDARSAIDAADPAHRCHAEAAPAPIERAWQAKYCLTRSHPQCERYQQALARRGNRVLGRAPIGDGLASTRMILAPEPPWRGMAGRARGRRARRVASAGGVVALLGVATLAATAAADGAPESREPSVRAVAATSTQTATPTQRPTLRPTPTVTPAPTVAPTPTEEPTPTPEVRTYVVVEGDTLGSIAAAFDTTVEAIQEANDLADPDSLTVGDTLVIP